MDKKEQSSQQTSKQNNINNEPAKEEMLQMEKDLEKTEITNQQNLISQELVQEVIDRENQTVEELTQIIDFNSMFGL